MGKTYTLSKEQKALAFNRAIPPVLEIESGDTVTYETGDFAYERLSKGETVEAIGLSNFNAVTGPVYVRGAQPGDVLRIEIEDVKITRAWSVWLPGFGGLGGKTGEMRVKQMSIHGDRVFVADGLSVPLRPMIGCIGVAPAEGEGSTFRPGYRFGGNLDLSEMAAGTTLYLPVEVPGALLSMGDLHAAMGTAEPTWIGLEAAGSATLTISVEKGKKLNFPRLRVGSSTYCLGIADTFEEAHQIALDEAFDLLTNDWQLEPFDAYAYASACVDMRLGGPLGVIVMAVVPDRA
jgi:amidase